MGSVGAERSNNQKEETTQTATVPTAVGGGSNWQKCVLQYEMSALKFDDAAKTDGGDGGVFAISCATDTAALTVACLSAASGFALRAVAEFQAALVLSAELRAANARSESTSHLVRRKIGAVDTAPEHWMVVYMDAGCVRIFGRGRFACYFHDSAQNFWDCGGSAAGDEYDTERLLDDERPLTLLVTSSPHTESRERLRCLIEASRTLQSTTDSLAVAYVNYLVADGGFCVFALTATRRRDDGAAAGGNCWQSARRTPGSPKKSELRVLDSGCDRISRMSHVISQSTDTLEPDVD